MDLSYLGLGIPAVLLARGVMYVVEMMAERWMLRRAQAES